MVKTWNFQEVGIKYHFFINDIYQKILQWLHIYIPIGDKTENGLATKSRTNFLRPMLHF